MNRRIVTLLEICAGLCASLPMPAQPNGIVFGSGYEPQKLHVAPGQVVTIFASGVGAGITRRIRASSIPWPTELGGISVEFAGYQRSPVKIAQIEPFSTCPWNFEIIALRRQSCGRYLAITLQIPVLIRQRFGTAQPPIWFGLGTQREWC